MLTKFERFLLNLGANAASVAATGARLVGPLVPLNTTNAGGYMNPNVIDGYSYNPSSGQWYAPSIFNGEFDFNNPASAAKKAELERARYWRELNNQVEGVGPGNGNAGDLYAPTIGELLEKLPQIVDRYREILPDIWSELKDYAISPIWDAIARSNVRTGNLAVDLAVNAMFTAARNFILRRDPLVLDLDGDGLELIGANGTVVFDHNADGIKTGTGWAGADDGLLVRDLNGNGLIDTGRELFGIDTIKANNTLAKDGFDALRDLVSNADGQITVADAAFAELKVWRDLNQDGINQAGELHTLQSPGVTDLWVKGTCACYALNSCLRNSSSRNRLNAYKKIHKHHRPLAVNRKPA